MLLINIPHLNEYTDVNYDSISVKQIGEMMQNDFYEDSIIYVGF